MPQEDAGGLAVVLHVVDRHAPVEAVKLPLDAVERILGATLHRLELLEVVKEGGDNLVVHSLRDLPDNAGHLGVVHVRPSFSACAVGKKRARPGAHRR